MYKYNVVNGVVKKISLTSEMSRLERLSLETYVMANFNFKNLPAGKMRRINLMAEKIEDINVLSLENSAYTTIARYYLSNEAVDISDTVRNALNWMNSINNYTNAISDGLKTIDKTYSTVSNNNLLNNFTTNKDKLDIIIRLVIDSLTNKSTPLENNFSASPELIGALSEICKMLQLKNAPITFKDYVARVVGLVDKVNKAFIENDFNIDLTVASEDLISQYTGIMKITDDNSNQNYVSQYNTDSFIYDYNVLMNTVDYNTKTNIKKLMEFIQNTTKRIERIKKSYSGDEYNLVVATQTVLNLITYVCYYYEKHLKLNAYMKSLSDSLMYVNI